MARSRKNLNVQNLRKSGDVYKDTKTGMEFKKTTKGYNMVVNKQAQREHQANVRRLKKLNDKYGGAFSSELKKENENWNDYKKAITQFNKGEKARPGTVKKELDYFQKSSKEQAKIYSDEKRVSSIVSDKRKVTLMRMSGKHGVYNGKAYDDYLKVMAKDLGMSVEEVEPLIFPTENDNEIKYEEYQSFFKSSKKKNVFDIIDEQEASGTLSEAKAIEVRNNAMVGIE